MEIVDGTGASTGQVEIRDEWLVPEGGDQAVRDVVVAYLAAQRAGTACTKTRGNVSGGGAKPYRQKGTGRARAGSNRSPIWRGGGIIFGPVPRDYSMKVNRKIRRLALRRAFTARLQQGEVIVLDKIAFEEPKTKSMAALLSNIGAGENALVVINAQSSPNVMLAGRNLAKVSVVDAEVVNVYEMLLHKKVVITQDAMETLGQRLGKQ